MIDLTNDNHRRGIVILSSKDMRTGVNALFDWKVHTGCAESYLQTLRRRLESMDMDNSIKDQCLSDVDFCLDWIQKSSKDIDKAREIFR